MKTQTSQNGQKVIQKRQMPMILSAAHSHLTRNIDASD